MHLEQLIIKSNIRDYSVFFEKNDNFLKDLSKLQNVVFVIDKNVWELHKNGILKCLPLDKIIVQPVCEDIKNIDTVCSLYEKIMTFAPRKNMNLVSIGGGIIQDITGFVASSLYRGINWIFIPTTLLAQVDSCIGAKTSLNFKHFKNLIGTFYPPSKIYIYPDFLKTLTKQDYYAGVGEMAKLHLMKGKNDTNDFINSLELIDKLDATTLLERTQNCLKIKQSYIEADEFDTGKRNMLNYGHCFGHAIESSTNFAISHGQAVVIGMLLANKIAVKKEILSKEQETFIREKVLLPVLKVNIPKTNVDKTIKAMRQDKKNTGEGLTLVMLNTDYQMIKITDLQENDVKEIITKNLFNKSVKMFEQFDNFDNFIFDLDGTLIDSSSEVLCCLEKAFNECNVKFDKTKLTTDIMGPTLSEIIRLVIPTLKDEKIIQNIVLKYRSLYDNDNTDQTQLYDGILDWLLYLKSNNKKIYIATNKPKIPTMRLIKKLNIDFFNDIYTADKNENKKMTKQEMIEEIIVNYSLIKNKTVMVGDILSDINSAHQAGIFTIGALWGYSDNKPLLR